MSPRDLERTRLTSSEDTESETDEVRDTAKAGRDQLNAEAQFSEVFHNAGLTRSPQPLARVKRAKALKGAHSAPSDGMTAGHAFAEEEPQLDVPRSDAPRHRQVDRADRLFGTAADFRGYLKSEIDGLTLESRFEGGSLEAQLDQYQRAFADGALGFTPDLNRLRINMSGQHRDDIRSGIASGRLTGVVLIAYPNRAQVFSMATRCGVRADKLLSMPVTEFLARHFLARGGLIHDERRSIESWRDLRWAAPEGPSLAAIFRANAKAMGIEPRRWLDEDGYRSRDHIDLQACVYQSLPAQTVLGDLLGSVRLVLTNLSRDVPATVPVGDGEAKLPQGADISHIRLLQAGIDMLTPEEYLALLATSSPPSTDTYPAQHTWEWLAAISPRFAARADSGAVGLVLREENPAFDGAWNCRVRPVLRA